MTQDWVTAKPCCPQPRSEAPNALTYRTHKCLLVRAFCGRYSRLRKQAYKSHRRVFWNERQRSDRISTLPPILAPANTPPAARWSFWSGTKCSDRISTPPPILAPANTPPAARWSFWSGTKCSDRISSPTLIHAPAFLSLRGTK